MLKTWNITAMGEIMFRPGREFCLFRGEERSDFSRRPQGKFRKLRHSFWSESGWSGICDDCRVEYDVTKSAMAIDSGVHERCKMDTPYATLVKAARSLQKGELIENFPDVSIDAIEEYFEVNRCDLELANEALDQKPSVPVEYRPDWLSSTGDSHRKLSYLAFVFSVEIHLWAHRQDFRRAAEIGIKGLEYCNAVRRGGLFMDALLSGLCVSAILQQLNRIRAQFNSEQRRYLVDELARIESERESFGSIEARDKKWTSVVDGLLPDTSAVDRLMDDLEAEGEILVEEKKRGGSTEELRARMKDHYLFVYADELDAPIEQQRARMKEVYLDERNSEAREALDKKIFQSDQKWPCLMRMLAVDLKLRSFKEEQGRYPDRLDQLAHAGTRACPTDPFTGSDFVYRRIYKRRFFRTAIETFDLYSPGRMETGQGGVKSSSRSVSQGDTKICLDMVLC